MSIPEIDICLDCRHLYSDHIPPSLHYDIDAIDNLGYCVGTKACKCHKFQSLHAYVE